MPKARKILKWIQKRKEVLKDGDTRIRDRSDLLDGRRSSFSVGDDLRRRLNDL